MHLAQAVCHSSHVLVIPGPAFKTTTYGAPICAFLGGEGGADRPLLASTAPRSHVLAVPHSKLFGHRVKKRYRQMLSRRFIIRLVR